MCALSGRALSAAENKRRSMQYGTAVLLISAVIVKLIGADVLPEGQKATLEVARVIRLGFLQQNAFHKEDTYVPLKKQNLMMDTILYFDDKMKELVADAIPVSLVAKTGIADEIIKMKYNIPNDAPEKFFTLRSKIESVFDGIIAENKA